MTDPEIAEIVFREVIGRDGSEAERAEAIAGYLSHLEDAVNESSGYRVMPGIEELLPRLVERGVLLGIVTGNIEAAAHIKLARADLNRFFAFGGYGSDSRDRTELTRKALERGGAVAGAPLDRAAAIAVGDTPRDVSAGHGAGIQRRRRRHRQLQRRGTAPRPAPTGPTRPTSPPAFPRLSALRPAAGLVDRGEAALEAVAGGAQVEAPDADPFGAGEPDRLVEVVVEVAGPVAQGLGVVGGEVLDVVGDEAGPFQRQQVAREVQRRRVGEDVALGEGARPRRRCGAGG